MPLLPFVALCVSPHTCSHYGLVSGLNMSDEEPPSSPVGVSPDLPDYNKVALITGITGQDGSYLTELLL